MKDTELMARLRRLGMSADKAREVTRLIRDELHPTAAVAATMVRRADLAGMGALPAAAIVGGKVLSGAASIVQAFGIGGKGTKPQRRAQALQVLSELRALPPDFQGRQIEIGTKKPSSGIYLLLQAVHYAGWLPEWNDAWTNNPGTIEEFSEALVNNSEKALRAVLSQPVGSQINLTLENEPRNQRRAQIPYSFTNPGYQSAAQFASQVIAPICGAMFADFKNQKTNIPAAISFPPFLQVATLLADNLHARLAPANVSTQVAQQPVAQVPTQIAAPAAQIANEVIQSNVTPAIVAPVVPTVAAAPTVATGPLPLAPTMNYGAVPTSLPPTQDMTAGILQTLLSRETGSNFVSPESQRIIVDVATQGVQQTPQGPPALPKWAIPAGIGVAALLAVALIFKRK